MPNLKITLKQAIDAKNVFGDVFETKTIMFVNCRYLFTKQGNLRHVTTEALKNAHDKSLEYTLKLLRCHLNENRSKAKLSGLQISEIVCPVYTDKEGNVCEVCLFEDKLIGDQTACFVDTIETIPCIGEYLLK